MRHYRKILLVNSSEKQLYSFKYVMEMFGIAEHIQAETSCTSALHYLRSTKPLPDLVMAVLKQEEMEIDKLVRGYESFPPEMRKNSVLVFLYDEESVHNERYKSYRQYKTPVSIPELIDIRPWNEQMLN